MARNRKELQWGIKRGGKKHARLQLRAPDPLRGSASLALALRGLALRGGGSGPWRRCGGAMVRGPCSHAEGGRAEGGCAKGGRRRITGWLAYPTGGGGGCHRCPRLSAAKVPVVSYGTVYPLLYPVL